MASARYCSAKNCKNKSVKNAGEKGLRFYRFPKDQQRCAKWVQNCGREDFKTKSIEYLNKNCLLCSAHFEQSQQFPYSNRLVWNAIPTLFHGLTPKFPVKKRSAGVNDDPPPKKLQQDPNNPLSRTDLRRISTEHGYCVPSFSPVYLTEKQLILNDSSQNNKETPSHTEDHPSVKYFDVSMLPTVPAKPKEVNPVILKRNGTTSVRCQTKLTSVTMDTIDNTAKSKAEEIRKNNSAHRVKLYRLRKKVEKLEKQLIGASKCKNSVEHIVELAKNYIEGPSLDFFETQLTAGLREKRGRRYPESVFTIANNVLERSPSAYRYLCHIFTLPKARTVKQQIRRKKHSNDMQTSSVEVPLSDSLNEDCNNLGLQEASNSVQQDPDVHQCEGLSIGENLILVDTSDAHSLYSIVQSVASSLDQASTMEITIPECSQDDSDVDQTSDVSRASQDESNCCLSFTQVSQTVNDDGLEIMKNCTIPLPDGFPVIEASDLSVSVMENVNTITDKN